MEISQMSRLVPIKDWAEAAGMSRAQAYKYVSKMPEGVRVRLGGRIRLHLDNLNKWLSQGGNLAEWAG